MKTQFSNHEAVRLQFMTQSVNSLLSGENCLKQRKSTYDKRFIRYHKCFLLKLRYWAHAKRFSAFFVFQLLKSFKRFHHVIAEGFAGGAGGTSCDNKLLFLEGADVKGSFKLIGSVLVADVGKEHHAGAEH